MFDEPNFSNVDKVKDMTFEQLEYRINSSKYNKPQNDNDEDGKSHLTDKPT